MSVSFESAANRLSFLPEAAARTLLALLAGTATLFTIRRLSAEFVQPLSPGWIASTGLVLGGTLLFIHHAMPTWDRRFVPTCVATSAAVILGLALWMPGSSFFAVAIFWVFIALCEFACFQGLRHTALARSETSAPATTPGGPAEEEEFGEESEVFAGEEPREEHLRRLKDETGRECVEGQVRISFEPGQRVGYAHIPICPPFLGAPEFECHWIAGPECRIRPTQVQPFGVRIEAKLPEEAPRQCDVWVFFCAARGE